MGNLQSHVRFLAYFNYEYYFSLLFCLKYLNYTTSANSILAAEYHILEYDALIFGVELLLSSHMLTRSHPPHL